MTYNGWMERSGKLEIILQSGYLSMRDLYQQEFGDVSTETFYSLIRGKRRGILKRYLLKRLLTILKTTEDEFYGDYPINDQDYATQEMEWQIR